MEYRISHLWVTSSNTKGHKKPLSSGGPWERVQGTSAATNVARMTGTHCTLSQGRARKLMPSEVTPGSGQHETEGQN